MEYSVSSKLNANRDHKKSYLVLVVWISISGFFCPHAVGQLAEGDSETAPKQVTATLPNGRRITPLGGWISIAPFPFSLALRPDGEQLTAPSLGFPFALNVIDRPLSEDRKVTQLPSGFRSSPDVEVYTGVAYSPDGKLLYIASGQSGAVDVLVTDTWKKAGRIDLNGALGDRVYKESFAAALVLSANGQQLYVIDEANWRVVVIDTGTKTRIASLPSGVNPIALCLSPDGKRLYIAIRNG
jgi:YVTN family beta-propeller protein